jgi:hypothetical protein
LAIDFKDQGRGADGVLADVFNFLGTSENSTFVSQSTVFTLVEVGDKCSLKYKPKNNVQQTNHNGSAVIIREEYGVYLPKNNVNTTVICIFNESI